MFVIGPLADKSSRTAERPLLGEADVAIDWPNVCFDDRTLESTTNVRISPFRQMEI